MHSFYRKQPKQLFICCPESISHYRQIEIVYAENKPECISKLQKWGYDIADIKIIQVNLRGPYAKVYEEDQFILQEVK